MSNHNSGFLSDSTYLLHTFPIFKKNSDWTIILSIFQGVSAIFGWSRVHLPLYRSRLVSSNLIGNYILWVPQPLYLHFAVFLQGIFRKDISCVFPQNYLLDIDCTFQIIAFILCCAARENPRLDLLIFSPTRYQRVSQLQLLRW